MIKLRSIAVTSLLFGFSVSSALASSYYDYARVLKAKPVYHYVKVSQPVQHCYPVEPTTRQQRSNYHHSDRDGATIVGTVLGGALGNVIGKATGGNRKVTTIAGAVIGASIGHNSGHNRYDRNNRSRVRMEQRCETVYQKTKKVREIKGYNVKYRYDGEAYNAFMRKHPGDKIKVRVRVSPAGYD